MDATWLNQRLSIPSRQNIERAFSPLWLVLALYLGLRPRLVWDAPLALFVRWGFRDSLLRMQVLICEGCDGER